MEEYVREFVNDTRQPSEFCSAGEDGMCRLDEFVKSQWHARNDGFGDFEKYDHAGWWWGLNITFLTRPGLECLRVFMALASYAPSLAYSCTSLILRQAFSCATDDGPSCRILSSHHLYITPSTCRQ